MLESWEDRRLIARLVAEVVGDRGWLWTIVRAKSVAASCSKLLIWRFLVAERFYIVVPPVFHDRSTNRAWSQATNWRSRTNGRATGRATYCTSSISGASSPIVDWHTITHDWWCDHTRLVVRPCKTCLLLVIAALKFVTWPSTLLRLILLARSPTTTTISGTISLRFQHFWVMTYSQGWCDCGYRRHENSL